MKGAAKGPGDPRGGGDREPQKSAVYVTGLPKTVTWAMVDLLFTGVGRVVKIKIYRDDGGVPKGDALVVFAKPGSVTVAVNKVDKVHTFPLDPWQPMTSNDDHLSHLSALFNTCYHLLPPTTYHLPPLTTYYNLHFKFIATFH